MAGDKTTCPICAMIKWADESAETSIWAALALGAGLGPNVVAGMRVLRGCMCPAHNESAARALTQADGKIDEYEKGYGKPQN